MAMGKKAIESILFGLQTAGALVTGMGGGFALSHFIRPNNRYAIEGPSIMAIGTAVAIGAWYLEDAI